MDSQSLNIDQLSYDVLGNFTTKDLESYAEANDIIFSDDDFLAEQLDMENLFMVLHRHKKQELKSMSKEDLLKLRNNLKK